MSLVDKQSKLFPEINSVYDNFKISVYKTNVLIERRPPLKRETLERRSSAAEIKIKTIPDTLPKNF